MLAAQRDFSAESNEDYLFVIGGSGADWRAENTVYRLSLKTYEWTIMTPMGTVDIVI